MSTTWLRSGTASSEQLVASFPGMNGLVPEQRTNYLGVTQTKWVKPEQHATAPAAGSIPAPAVTRSAAEVDSGYRLDALKGLDRFAENFGYDEDYGADLLEDARLIVGRLDGRTARFFTEMLETVSEHYGIVEAVADLIDDPATPEARRNTVVFNYLSCIPEGLDDRGLEQCDATAAADALFAALPPEVRNEPFTDEYGEACRALALAARRFDDDAQGFMVARTHSFAGAAEILPVLAQRPELAESVAQRGALDATTIREMAAAAGALGAGVL